jgi:TRPM family ion channel
MRKEKIYFPDRQTVCVFPNERSELPQVIADLNLKDRYPVIVLIGGDIDKQQAVVTLQAVQTIARIAEDLHAVVVCGGTNMGVMAEIGQIRRQQHYKFPLVGVAPEGLVTWPGGPYSTKFLWWGIKRWQLESHYSHFILVPGSQFGDESSWIVDTATCLSKDHQSVTILINGGEISRRDIDLSLEYGRPVVALSRTGRLADEFARQPDRNKLITVIPANAAQKIVEVVQAALSVKTSTVPIQTLNQQANQVKIPQTV